MKIRILTAGVAALALAAGLAGCASGGEAPASTDASKPYAGTTLKYWATNQGPSLDADTEILTPELDKFEEQTGIKVDLEVVPWSDMTNNTLAAAVSGQGPDVVNIGNTNATTLNTTGAFLPFEGADLDAIGGEDKFLESAWQSTGPEGVRAHLAPAVQPGLRPLLQQGAVRGEEPRAADHVGRARRRRQAAHRSRRRHVGRRRRGRHRERRDAPPVRLHRPGRRLAVHVRASPTSRPTRMSRACVSTST